MFGNFALVLEKYGELYLQGLGMTVQLTLLSLAVGFVLAWPLALALAAKQRGIRLPVRAFVYYATGTPLLVQLFLVYFGLGQFVAVRESPLWVVLQEPYWCALIAFSLNTAAYSAEIFNGALKKYSGGRNRSGTCLRHGRCADINANCRAFGFSPGVTGVRQRSDFFNA